MALVHAGSQGAAQAADPVPEADIAQAEDFFEKQVRPILAARCLECHGDENPEAGLSLTSRSSLLAGGQSGSAALEGRPDESLLLRAVLQDGELSMPPEGKLREDEIAALRQWIEMGLPWPDDAEQAASGGTRPPGMGVTDADRRHWAYRSIADPAPPAVADASWPKTAIDRFILARLEAAGIGPAAAADRRTLIRRAYYDLVGLPPTWEEVQRFAGDTAPGAFERVVDRLLASPGYGERWGRHWLDVARYADTKDGVLMYGDDRVRPFAYTYRDYVIRAFNEDIGFDRFVQEQLAADQIEPPIEPWRLAAMGFLTLGRMFDNNVHDVIDDQIDVVSRGFLGLTVACARCHDHKYDAVPTADYYSLYGVFASSEAPLELPLVQAPEKMAGGVEFEAQAAAKRQELRQMLDDQYALLTATARQRVGDYLVHVATTQPDPLETAIFFMSLAPEDLRPPITARWRQLVAERATPEDPVFGPWHDLMQNSSAEAENRLAAEAEGPLAAEAGAVIERWSQRPAGAQPGQVNPLVLAALADAAGRGELKSRADVARAYGAAFEEVQQAPAAAGGTASGVPSGASDPDSRQQLLDMVAGRESPNWFAKNQTRRFMSRMEKDAFGGKLQELDRMAVQSPHAPPRAMVLRDAQELYDPCIFVRGNASQRGEPVARQFLEVLSHGRREAFVHGSGRLDLARAIASPDNPLTGRVLVNRVWMHHFGEPLVSTPSDFGTRSTPPVHPELLDHLAARFMADGWSLKKLHRRIMLSAVYQQAAAPRAELAAAVAAADPDNKLFSRMPRQRLSFEAMRDTLLWISGRLEPRGSGRPVDVAGDPLCRHRTVYGLVDRQSLPGVFRVFDFAAPDQSVERRPRTMVPQQALFALNAPFVIEQARSLAQGVTEGGPDGASRVAALYRRVFARDPTSEEMAGCLAFVEQGAEAGSDLGVWEQLAQVLLCSSELMYLD